MRNRRLARLPSSDDEDEAPPHRNLKHDEDKRGRKRKKLQLPDEEEEDKEIEEPKRNDKKNNKKREESDDEAGGENDVVAQPLGEVIRVSGKGRGRRSHYSSFEYDGLQYQLEDSVLLVPENGQKPYVAIIKDIAQTQKGDVHVTGQWFYRPEEAEKRDGGNWQSNDSRDLFYSFHRDEVPGESVMHKCIVHFIPLDKQIPYRKEHPGFIVQKVYDTEQRRLFKLTDKDYEDRKQHEIDLLVEKTLKRIGDLEPEEAIMDREDREKNKRLIRKRNVSPHDVSREDEGLARSQSFRAQTPANAGGSSSEHYTILSNFKTLTGETQRDKWLEKLLQSIQSLCCPVGGKEDVEDKNICSNNRNESQDKNDAPVYWPDAAVHVVATLERAAHDTLSSDFQKYNQKMRQLTFNFTKNGALARRLLNEELEPAQILNMGPTELKEGLTAEEIESRTPKESGTMQMTDARCKRCNLKQAGLLEIFQTGHGDRYQLECAGCGYRWYTSRDDASTLTIEGPNSVQTIGTAPLATAKFEDVEKNLVSPSGPENGANDVLNKTTEAYMPVLDMPKSLNKNRVDDPTTTKEDSLKRESGSKVHHANIQASKAVTDIIRTTLGPRSMLKMLLDAAGGRKKTGSSGIPGSRHRPSMNLRDESRVKKQGNVNAKTRQKLDHLKSLAVWAAEESIPSLGAFFGERLAASTELLGIRGDPSLFVCERCESILQPGKNCTVRIEKSNSKKHRSKKSSLATQNNVVCRCHFCSHRNTMRGTPKGYMREIYPPKIKSQPRLKPSQSSPGKESSLAKARDILSEVDRAESVGMPAAAGQNLEISSQATPLPPTGLSLLDSRRKRNRSGAKKIAKFDLSSSVADAEQSVPPSSKRRKKSWMSLKEIAQSNEHDSQKKFANLTIPFLI